MFFTQEDYRKIEKWLLANSRKDTDFAGAATPLKGNETVAFVQDGVNVKVSLKDLISQIFLLGVSDFLNVTDKYGESYISLTQAIQLIPYKSRKIGQVITFLNPEGAWNLYQFQGTRVNQWNNTTLWIDLIRQIQGIAIIGSEDIVPKVNTVNQTALYLADKQYDNVNYSGLGRVYLRKNIQRVQDPTTGEEYTTNLLYQLMISKESTIYIIQYDYDLNQQSITIPANSVLLFEGGSISNGTITGTNTRIGATKELIFGEGISIAGTWNIERIYSSNFKVNPTNCYPALSNLPKFSNGVDKLTVEITEGDYNVTFPANNSSLLELNNNTDLIVNGNINVNTNNYPRYNVILVSNVTNVTVTGTGVLKGDCDTHIPNPSGGADELGMGIKVGGGKNISISGVTIKNMWGDGIYVTAGYYPIPEGVDGDSKNVLIENIITDSNRRNNVTFESSVNVTIKNSVIKNAGTINGTAPKYGIDIEPIANFNISNITIDSCSFSGNVEGAILTTTPGSLTGVYENIYLKNLSIPDKVSLQEANFYIESCKLDTLNFITHKPINISNSEIVLVSNSEYGLYIVNSIVSIKDVNKLSNFSATNCIFPHFGISSSVTKSYISNSIFTNYYKVAQPSIVNFGYNNLGLDITFTGCTFIKDSLSNLLINYSQIPQNSGRITYNSCNFIIEDSTTLNLQSVILNNCTIDGNSNIIFSSRAGNNSKINSSIIKCTDIGITDLEGTYYCFNSILETSSENDIFHSITQDSKVKPLYLKGNKANKPFRLKDIMESSSLFSADLKETILNDGTDWLNTDGTLTTKVVIV
jgi:hypothetical protein